MKQETARYSLWSPPTFVTATGALVAEATFAAALFVLWTLVYPDAGPGSGSGSDSLDPSEEDSGAFGILFLPFFAAAWTLVAAFLAAALVVPTAALARWAGSRPGLGGARRWAPTAAAPVAAAAVAAAAVLAAVLIPGHADALTRHPVTCLWWWLGVTAAVAPAALLTLVTDRRAASGRRPWRLPLWLLGGGCGGPLIAFVLVIVVGMVVNLVND
ncbi:hypothetical protein GCM10010324_07540 [Streptomyces hiroshimensis]|uniref:Integral membrane protein n=1 Tax=Streptomyces hiroshimensis TaxID=66424 RepID=A0ABQ2Y6T8_9ACTN|nr:hypothetical protein [Streptomyces hiroshimensis]GGX65026.1 hypothetical protein GCM10010324_07540 [Streptomyces hiroshimensis]